MAMAILLAAAGAALLTIAVGSAQASAPIEGVWSFSGGNVAVKAEADGTFVGKVVAPTQFAECPHPVGEEMWTQITLQPDGSYWGSHRWFFSTADCIANPLLGPTAWRVIGNNSSRFLRVCFSEPGRDVQPTIAPDGTSANATFGCADSSRISSLPKLSPTKLAQHVHLPRGKTCIGSRRMRIHLQDPDNDPFLKIEVSLRSGKVHRQARIRHHRHNAIAILNLENLPKADFTVSARLTTVLGRRLSLRRKYRKCGASGPRRTQKPVPHAG